MSGLILERRPGERIFLSGGIVITVLPSIGLRMRWQIRAPDGVDIAREEIASAALRAEAEATTDGAQ